jgi:ABC-type branched-subunit amino acid transport system permease subunit
MSAATTPAPDTGRNAPVTSRISRRSDAAEARIAMAKRLASCLALGFVLALMIGTQEGTQQDFGYAFRKAVFGPRILLFLGIGVLVFLAMTFWPRLTPYLRRPGIRPLAAGALTVVASLGLLNWSDSGQLDSPKFSGLSKAAADTGALDPITRLYFGSAIPGLAWILLVVVVALALAAIIRTSSGLAWAVSVLAVLAGIWGFYAQSAVRSLLQTPDHATGPLVALLGYLTIASATATCALATGEEADSRGFVNRAFSWRPGLPLVVIAVVTGLMSLLVAGWFSPTNRNDHLVGLSSRFAGSGVSGLSSAYYTWLVWVLFVATLALAGWACYQRNAKLGWAALGLGVVSTILTLLTLHDISGVAAKTGFDGAKGAWDNLGVGGWLMAGTFTLLAGAGWVCATRADARASAVVSSDEVGSSRFTSPDVTKVVFAIVIAGALFYPPTATQFWQTVLVTEIGIYVLLAIGLNVVVGWAGLLDLGFIAFYAIGSYTTAYLTDRLPVKPPDWLHLSPLEAIPFAILICLVAGVLLGAPTLRLRGDYLAIVTLGFGEIIRVVANNAEPITNGSRGAFNIPPPEIHLGPIDFKWGGSALGFWYLLLVLVVIVVVLFRRLEDSRLGRAWAAIREDEVAAQATGINTTRVKLLAFAIGASTSGVAGVFFASQVGSFTPENFILNNSILVVAYVVFGGMGSLPGAMAGAAVLTWLPEFLKDQVPAEDRQMWIGAVILLMMIFRPAGLIPAKRRAAELSGLDKSESSETKAVPAGEGM